MEIFWKKFDKVVIGGLDDVVKEVVWVLIFGLLFGIVIEELVNLGYLSLYFYRNFGFNNYFV